MMSYSRSLRGCNRAFNHFNLTPTGQSFIEPSLFSRSGRLVFLCDKNLEAGVTLRGRIYRLVGEEDCCAWRDDSSRLPEEVIRNPTLLCRRK